MYFIIVIIGDLWQGGKVSIFKSRNFRKFTGFLCEYGWIKRDKTDSIASILMQFESLVVKIMLKHKINEILFFGVKKWFLKN